MHKKEAAEGVPLPCSALDKAGHFKQADIFSNKRLDAVLAFAIFRLLSAGSIEAPFAGEHGWFWRNRDDADVTIALRLRDDYSNLVRSD